MTRHSEGNSDRRERREDSIDGFPSVSDDAATDCKR
jgi:hypothetical protein